MVRASALQSVDLGAGGSITMSNHTRRLLKIIFKASLLSALHLGEVVENKPASLLVVPWARHLIGCPHLYVEGRWPRHHGNGNSQASADVQSKILHYNLLSRKWRINMANKNIKK